MRTSRAGWRARLALRSSGHDSEPGGECGAAIVTSLALMALLAVVMLVGGTVTDLLAARQRAAAAADLGALAGAPASERSTVEACDAAAWVVRMNGASLRECSVLDGDVRITASARPRGPWSRWLSALLAGAVEPQVTAHAGMR